jgi:tRNA G18 (ribose-2'-O)-methylase SpoU
VPEYVHQDSDEVLKINMKAGARSLNVATSSAIVISEAIRQLKLI